MKRERKTAEGRVHMVFLPSRKARYMTASALLGQTLTELVEDALERHLKALARRGDLDLEKLDKLMRE